MQPKPVISGDQTKPRQLGACAAGAATTSGSALWPHQTAEVIRNMSCSHPSARDSAAGNSAGAAQPG